jgi:hypothetical protein
LGRCPCSLRCRAIPAGSRCTRAALPDL